MEAPWPDLAEPGRCAGYRPRVQRRDSVFLVLADPLDQRLEKGPGNLWMFLHKRSKLPLCENLASQVSLGGDNRRARTIVDEGHFPEIVTGSRCV